MKNRMFDIVTLSDHNSKVEYDKLEQLDFLGDVFGIFKDILGGGGGGGMPGDWDNRVRAGQQKAAQYGVVECIDQNVLQNLLMMPSGWQAAIDQYYGQLKNKKTTTGTCVPGQVIQKENGRVFPGSASIFDNPLVLLGLGAGAVFFLNKKK